MEAAGRSGHESSRLPGKGEYHAGKLFQALLFGDPFGVARCL